MFVDIFFSSGDKTVENVAVDIILYILYSNTDLGGLPTDAHFKESESPVEMLRGRLVQFHTLDANISIFFFHFFV